MKERASHSERQAGVLALLLLLCLASLAGCATGRVNAWPLFFHEVRRVQSPEGPKVVTSTDVVYPIFHRESEPGTSWYAVRPFYNYQRGPEPDRRQVQYLWPLGLYYSDSKRTEWRLWILAAYISVWSDLYQRWSTHVNVLQLLRWGNDAQFGPYLALIPLRRRHAQLHRGHVELRHVPPVLLLPAGQLHAHGLPLADPRLRLHAGQVARRCTASSPSSSTSGTTTRRASTCATTPPGRWCAGACWTCGARPTAPCWPWRPFFSTIRTYDRQGKLVAQHTSILGFSFQRDSREPERGGDWGALWWLVNRSSGDRRDDFRIFPFFWQTTYYRTDARDPARSWTRTRAPWPLVWVDHSRFNPDVERKSYWVAPFYWHYTDIYHTKGRPDRMARRITLWPLATWEHDKDNGYHFYMLSHGWNDTTHGYTRNYRALFDLFQYHSDAGGDREVRLLSRLYHSRSTPAGSYLSVAGLFTYDSTGEVVGQEGSYWSALFGLVKHSWTERKGHWRIFFIPVN